MDEERIRKLVNRIDRALELIDSAELNDGLNILKTVEERLKQIPITDQEIKIVTFHNLAMCYQLVEDYERCSKYLLKSIKISKKREHLLIVEKIRGYRYLTILFLHLSACMSHIGDHLNSVNYAKESYNYISKCFHICILNYSTSPDQNPGFLRNIQILESCLRFISNKLTSFPSTCGKIVQRSSLGVLHFNDWIYSFTINDLFELKPLKFFEIKNAHIYSAELSKDYMLEKVCLLMSTCYLIATESRILEDTDQASQAKSWHSRSVQIGLSLLPLETPLLQHIKSSYDKHYPETIPRFIKILKSKTPLRKAQAPTPRNRTIVRKSPLSTRKNLQELELKTERFMIRPQLTCKSKSPGRIIKRVSRTKREDQEPEPQLSDDSVVNQTCIINSNDLYGANIEDEVNSIIY